MGVLRDLLAHCVANATILEGRLQECQRLVEASVVDQEVETGTLLGITGLLILVGCIRLVVLARDGRPPIFVLDRYLTFLFLKKGKKENHLGEKVKFFIKRQCN